MAKFKPMELLSELHGKVCMHSDIAFVERNGTQFTVRRCNPRSVPPTENELQNRAKFKATRDAVKNLTPEQRQTYAQDFRKQTKYRTLQGYVFAQEYKKL